MKNKLQVIIESLVCFAAASGAYGMEKLDAENASYQSVFGTDVTSAELKKQTVESPKMDDGVVFTFFRVKLGTTAETIARFTAHYSRRSDVRLLSIHGKTPDIQNHLCLGIRKEGASEYIKRLYISTTAGKLDTVAENIQLEEKEAFEIVSLFSKNDLSVEGSTCLDVDGHATPSDLAGYPEYAVVRFRVENKFTSDCICEDEKSKVQCGCASGTNADVAIHTFAESSDILYSSSEGE